MGASAAWRRKVSDTWEEAARGWTLWDPLLMASMGAVNPVLQRALGLRAGQRLLDAGCGLGEPALSFAPLVAPGGRVLAVDLSRAMIASARRRASAGGIRNVRFLAADVMALDPRLRFDRVVSRYGIMFAEDSAALLARLRHHLKPRGRAAFAVWGPLAKNDYFRIVAEATRPFVRGPVPDPETVPHPLRFARVARLTRLMRRAGYRDVSVEGVSSPFTFQSPEQYAEVVLAVSGSTRELVRPFGPAALRRVRKALERGAGRHRDGNVVRVPAFAWVVSGRR